MRIVWSSVFLLLCLSAAYSQSNSYLFVWAGDDAKQSNDFLAVLDADAKSPRYGHVVSSVAVPGPSGTPHHTELEMPTGGFLLANAFESGRTVLFDLNRPQHPTVATTFGDLAGYMHPHTYIRLPNGDILATFQYHGGHEPTSEGGGLVEFDQRGQLVRSGSAMDPAAKTELIRPYSLVVIPALDRVVSTNTSMHFRSERETRTVQVWRLSDLKLLRTIILPPGPRGSEQLLPGEPRLLSDGKTVLIHTFSCGLYEMDGVASDQPSVKHVKTFDGERCAVPLRLGKYWVQTLFSEHAVASYDISDPAHIREVSRVSFDEKQKPHWIAADSEGRRIVLNSGEYGEHLLFILDFDPQTGSLALDKRFHDSGSNRPGVSMDGKTWPHGFRGDAYPHGTVFSRPSAAASASGARQVPDL
jgi:56kDa selenium binding protein (SBP56)